MRLVEIAELGLRAGELILGFVKALAWPGVALVVFLYLKPQLQRLVGKLERASWRDAELTFNLDAEAFSHSTASYRDAVVKNPPEPEERPEEVDPEDEEESTEDEDESTASLRDFHLVNAIIELRNGPDFVAARSVIRDSPDAAVILAFRELERVARAALTAQSLGEVPSMHAGRLIRAALPGKESLPLDSAEVLETLVRLRNEVVHGVADTDSYTVKGVEAYIEACENLSEAIMSVTISKVRHPSRSGTVWEAVHRVGVDPVELGLRPPLR